MQHIKEYYDKLMRLNYINRYSNLPRIKNETVAAHSFLVACIVIKLHELYDFDLEHALFLAICHDIPEYEVNDITHEIKQKYPNVAKALKDVEFTALQDLPSIILHAYIEFEKGESYESRIVALADVTQCMQYAENEVALGNDGYMSQVVIDSRQRAAALCETLKEIML